MVGLAIKESRELKGITQKDLAQVSFLSSKTISAIETGRRALTEENLKNICKELDDPRVYFEAASEICGDVFSVHWLNGDAADLHRASVKEKVIEELSEAIRAINLTKIYKNPKTCTMEEVETAKQSIQESIDVFNSSAIYIAVMCREYGFSITEMFSIHKKKLIDRKYLKGRPAEW